MDVSLHELCVDSLGAPGQPMAPPMALALQASFGSVERWRAEFVALARSLESGPGWVLLAFLPRAGRLVNLVAADPLHAQAAGVPILALQRQQHDRPMDVDALMDTIDWARAYQRYQDAVEAPSEPFGATGDDIDGALLLDVRRAGVFEQASQLIPGARWCDPADVDRWARGLPADREVVVYCVYGHEVGRATAMRLRAAGIEARFLRGGIDGWAAAGRPLAPKA